MAFDSPLLSNAAQPNTTFWGQESQSSKFGPYIEWTPIDKSTLKRYDVIPAAARRMTELMEEMSPASLAQAVPYIRIYEINADGSLGKKLSNQLIEPPKFGQPMNKRFSERPPVSIENVSVKYMMPRGWILYRELDMSIVVHKPDAVFDAAQGSLMQSLLDFSKQHVIMYGWSGGSSVLSNGPPPENPDPILPDTSRASGYDDYSRGLLIAHDPIPGTQDGLPPDYREAMPVKAVVRFKVVNYNFSIEPDMQVKFHIHAIEDGEVATRDAVIFNNRNILPLFDMPENQDLYRASEVFDRISAYFIDTLLQRREWKDIYVSDKKDLTKPPVLQKEQFIKLQHIFNAFFADPIVFSTRSLGYKHTYLHLGLFNDNCPRTTAAYANQDVAGKSVADFLIPLKKVSDLVARMITANSQMTAYGMIREISGLVSSPEVWETNSYDKKMIPELVLRTRYNWDTSSAIFQLIDRKFFVANSELNIGVAGEMPKNKLRGLLKDKNIPYLRLMTKLSYLKDVKFEVVNDEQMKSIMINRSIAKTRADIAGGTARNSQLYGGMPGFAMMYRSAIKGTVTMLGNFAFDVFGIMWFEFGIPAYDGLFYVIHREDKISADGFFTTLTLQAEGSDPLRHGGARASGSALPAWITGDGNRSMYDWVKAMIRRKAIEADPEQALADVELERTGEGGI